MSPTSYFVSCLYSNYQDYLYWNLQSRHWTGKIIANSLSFLFYLWRQLNYLQTWEGHRTKWPWTKGSSSVRSLVGRIKRNKRDWKTTEYWVRIENYLQGLSVRWPQPNHLKVFGWESVVDKRRQMVEAGDQTVSTAAPIESRGGILFPRRSSK